MVWDDDEPVAVLVLLLHQKQVFCICRPCFQDQMSKQGKRRLPVKIFSIRGHLSVLVSSHKRYPLLTFSITLRGTEGLTKKKPATIKLKPGQSKGASSEMK